MRLWADTALRNQVAGKRHSGEWIDNRAREHSAALREFGHQAGQRGSVLVPRPLIGGKDIRRSLEKMANLQRTTYRGQARQAVIRQLGGVLAGQGKLLRIQSRVIESHSDCAVI